MTAASEVPSFSIEGTARRVDKPWGYEILWTPEGHPYVGKVLHVERGKRLSLQVHDAKEESWLLVSGRAKVIWDDETGALVETELQPGLGYSCEIGQRHRLVGITDCDIVEVSTPEVGTTHRLEDDYSRPDETEAVRASAGRGWSTPAGSDPRAR
ncbi:MAG: cupin [Acidimicrobiia bacterium]